MDENILYLKSKLLADMKFDYSIKNFRVFDSEGATFTISPITILTGTNSSGKSSMAKSLLLINNFLDALKSAAQKHSSNPMEIPLDFSDTEAMLGSFGKCLNYLAPKDSPITFSYKVHSMYLSQDCTVTWCFNSIDKRTGQQDGDGWVSALHVRSDNGSFELKIDFSKDGQNILKFSRRRALSAFFRDYKVLEILNEHISAERAYVEGYEIEESSQWYSIIIPDLLKTEVTQAQFEDISHLFVSFLNEGLFDDIETAKLVSPFNAISQLPIFNELHHLYKDGVFEDLRDLSNEEGWVTALEKMQEDFLALGVNNFEEYFLLKYNFWLAEGIFPSWYPFAGDFFRSLQLMLLINVNKSEFAFKGDRRQTFSFPDLMNILSRVIPSNCFDQFIQLDCAFIKFCSKVIEEVVFPPFVGRTQYISSSRAFVRRIYTKNDRGSSFDILLQQYEVGRKKATIGLSAGYNSEFVPGEFINRWLRRFEVGESLTIEPDGYGLGIIPYITKQGRKTPLSELGYGVTQIFSILLNIEASILFSDKNPLKNRPFYFIIEEPEIHLHPRLQALMADMFLEAYVKYNFHFIVETHSEYLIRKFQYLVAEHSLNAKLGMDPSFVSVYYFYDPYSKIKSEEQTQVQRISIQNDGILDHPFGDGFVDLSTELVLNMFALHNRHE